MTPATIAEAALAEVLVALEGVSHAHETPRETVMRLVEERARAVEISHSAQESAKHWQERAHMSAKDFAAAVADAKAWRQRAESAEAVLTRTASGP